MAHYGYYYPNRRPFLATLQFPGGRGVRDAETLVWAHDEAHALEGAENKRSDDRITIRLLDGAPLNRWDDGASSHYFPERVAVRELVGRERLQAELDEFETQLRTTLANRGEPTLFFKERGLVPLRELIEERKAQLREAEEG